MKKDIQWQATIQNPLRQSILDLVLNIANRLRDPSYVEKVANTAHGQLSAIREYPQSWNPPSITFGDAALALLYGQLDRCFPGQSWDQVAHLYLESSASPLKHTSISGLNLFGGLAGLCFVTNYLSRNGQRYKRFLRHIDALLIQGINKNAKNPSSYTTGVRFADYDLIFGPTGIGAYLLQRRKVPGASSALDNILDWLIFLSQNEYGKIRYFIPPEMQPSEERLNLSPGGATDCGLAHGVPGPLALLALVYKQSGNYQKVEDALHFLVNWVISNKYENKWGINWPISVPITLPEMTPEYPTRTAWCYGNPGVARALWLAGSAINDMTVLDLSIEAMRDVYNRPVGLRHIESPILCHGVAGLLQITLRFANDTGQDFFIDLATSLAQQLIDLYEPDSLTGFRDLKPDGYKVDNPGLLEGTSGILLTMLAATTNVDPSWDRLFLLS